MPKLSEIINADLQPQQDPSEADLLKAKDAYSEHNPDEVAGAMQVAERSEVSLSSVLGNKDSWNKAAEDETFLQAMKRAPRTARWMYAPENAAIAKDDVGGLVDLENTVDYLSGLVKRQNIAGSMFNAFVGGVATIDAAVARAPAFAYNMANLPHNLYAKIANRPDMYVQAPDWLMNNKVAKYYDKQAELLQPGAAGRGIWDQVSKGDIAGAGESIAVQLAANAPTQALLLLGGVAGKGMQALVAMGSMQAIQTAQESQDAGADPAAGTANALMQGTIEGLFESLGTMGLLKHWEGALAKEFGKATTWQVMKAVGKTVAYSFLGEGWEETATSFAQDFADMATGVNIHAMEGSIQRAIDAGIVGGLAGATMTAPAAVASGAASAKTKQATDFRVEYYQALGDKLKASKLYQRNPKKAGELVKQVVEGTPIENIYVPVEEFTEYWQSKQIDPKKAAEDLGALESFSQAQETGSKVKISTATWAEKIAGTEHYAGFAENFSLAEDELTAKQIKQVEEKFAEETAQETATMEERLKTDAETKKGHDLVYQDVLAKLSAIDRPDRIRPEQWQQAIQDYAKVWAARTTTEAIKRGVPVDQVYDPAKMRFETNNRLKKEIAGAMPSKASALRKIIELSPEDKEAADQVYKEVAEGQRGFKYVNRDEITGEVVRAGYEPSTFPEYFKNKGYTKKQVMDILDKVDVGESLTEKQQQIYNDLLEGYKDMLEPQTGPETGEGGGVKVFDDVDDAYSFINEIENSGGIADITRIDENGKASVRYYDKAPLFQGDQLELFDFNGNVNPAATPESVGNIPEASDAKIEKKEDQGKLRDVGQELWYNRRNLFGKALSWETIKDMNAALKVKEVVKHKIWARPDYEQLVADGMNPLVAYMVKDVYDSISLKPNTGRAPTDEQMQRFIDEIGRYKEAIFAWAKDVDQEVKKAQESGDETGGSVSFALKKNGSLLDRLYPPEPNKGRYRFQTNEDYAKRISIVGGNKVLQAMQPGYREIRSAIEKIKEGWPAPKEAWERRFMVRLTPAGTKLYRNKGWTVLEEPEYIIVERSSRMILADNIKTEAEAIEKAKQLAERKQKKGFLEETLDFKSLRREGPPRRPAGLNVKPEDLMREFGFRGVNFGNWTNQEERQLFVNQAYDALQDLAEIMRIPAKAISLNGLLGLAFGAQGTGGAAAAHFIPGVNEINLTKTSGAGSLAHEWAHALDHYFAAQAGDKYAKSNEPFISALFERMKEDSSVRPEIIKAFKEISQAMKERPETPEEVEARVKKRAADTKRRVDSWVKHFRDELELRLRDDQTKKEKAIKEFDLLADRIDRGDYGSGYESIGTGIFSQVTPVVGEIRRLFKDVTGRVPSNDEIRGLDANIQHARYVQETAAEGKAHIPQMVDTKYLTAAKKMDAEKSGKAYWTNDTELFARAFQSYVLDRLADQTRRNDYLTRPQDMAKKASEISGELFRYPEGEERTKINVAFDGLIRNIEVKETDKGAMLYQDPVAATYGTEVRPAGGVYSKLERAALEYETVDELAKAYKSGKLVNVNPQEGAGDISTGKIPNQPEGGNTHRPPSSQNGSRLDDLSKSYGGEDIYGKHALEYFGSGEDVLDKQSIEIIQNFRNKPDATIKIYRAVDKGVKTLSPGDWVTINKQYAKEHGDTVLDGKYDIIEKEVKVKELFGNGDSLHEYGYYPETTKQSDSIDLSNIPEELRPLAEEAKKYKTLKEFTSDHIEKITDDFYKGSKKIVAVGYRSGNAPKSGRSFNTRENEFEHGVSLIGVNNLPPVRSFAISGAREQGRDIKFYKGEIIKETGGDDEFLMQNPVEITKKEYDRFIDSYDGIKSSYVLSYWISDRKNILVGRGYDLKGGEKKWQVVFNNQEGLYKKELTNLFDQIHSLNNPRAATSAALFSFPQHLTSKQLSKIWYSAHKKYSQTLFQAAPEFPRGFIRFFHDHTIISLTKMADASTFIHESAHYWLKDMADFVQSGQADEAYLKDWQTISGWLGIKEGSFELSKDHQEKFARAFEAYLMEGKSPSKDLGTAFVRFRRWMLKLYQTVTGLGVELNDQVRDYFDRMLATEAAIEGAQIQEGQINAAEISPEVQAKLADLREQAKEEAFASLFKEQLNEIKKERRDQLKKERNRITKEVDDQLRQTKTYKLLDFIQGQFKKDPVEVAQKYLEGKLKRPDRAKFEAYADAKGYSAPEEMARAIISTVPLADAVVQQVEARMAQEYADLMSPQKLQEEAEKAVKNTKQGQVLALEIQMFEELVQQAEGRVAAKKERRARAAVEAEKAKSIAEEIINGKPVKEAGNFRVYFTAEKNAAVKAAEAVARGDYKAAAKAKRQQLVNHELARMAVHAKERAGQLNEWLANAGKKTVELPKGGKLRIDADTNVQVNRILNRYGYAPLLPEIADETREIPTLAQYLDGLSESGEEAVVADWILAGEIPHAMTLGHLEDLKDAIESIRHLGKRANELSTGENLVEVTDWMEEEIDKNLKISGQKYDPNSGNPVINGLSEYIFGVRNLTFIIRAMDKHTFGKISRFIMPRLREARVKEEKMSAEYADKLASVWDKHYPVKGNPVETALARWDMTHKRTMVTDPEALTWFPRGVTKEAAIMMALYQGAEINRTRLIDSFAIKQKSIDIETGKEVSIWQTTLQQENIDRILEQCLDKNDWDFVQAILNLNEEMWPAIADLQRNKTGIEPKKKKVVPIQTQFGEYPGGYFHIEYDRRYSQKAEQQQAEEGLKALVQDSHIIPSTERGHTKKTVPHVYGRKLRLQFGTIDAHFHAVIRDLCFNEPLRDIDRIFLRLRDPIVEHLGKNTFDQVRRILAYIGYERRPIASAGDGILSGIRARATAYYLMVRVTSILSQLAGMGPAMGAVGPHKYAAAVASIMVDPSKAQFALERSQHLRTRVQNRDQNVRDAMRRLSKKGTISDMQRFGFMLQGYLDVAVAIPQWLAAYDNELARQQREAEKADVTAAISVADESVAHAQGSGDPIDYNAWQRGGELQKMLSMFYTPFLPIANKEIELVEKFRNEGIKTVSDALMFATFWVIFPALADNLLRGDAPDGDDDGEEWVTWAARNIFNYFFAGWPGVRDAVGYITQYKGLGYRFSPVISSIELILKPFREACKAISGEEPDGEQIAVGLVRSVSFLAGIPKQVEVTIGHLVDWLRGEEDFSWRKGLFTNYERRR